MTDALQLFKNNCAGEGGPAGAQQPMAGWLAVQWLAFGANRLQNQHQGPQNRSGERGEINWGLA
jgi:hypothetical protein